MLESAAFAIGKFEKVRNQLCLGHLHQDSSKSNPMGQDFNYPKEFKSLDLAALEPLMHPHGCGAVPAPNMTAELETCRSRDTKMLEVRAT
jgi:hypothetical protein